jgi:DNA-binding response OmpR family regulator
MYRPLSLPRVGVLVAERSAYVRNIIREHLFVAGIRHLCLAEDQVQAMSHLEAGAFEAAIADWDLLTAGDGTLLKVLAEARRPDGGRTHLLAAMARPTRAGVVRARERGVRAALVRPFSPRALVGRLNRLLVEPVPDEDDGEVEFR